MLIYVLKYEHPIWTKSIYSDQSWKCRKKSGCVSTNESNVSCKYSISVVSAFRLGDKFAFCLLLNSFFEPVMLDLSRTLFFISLDTQLFLVNYIVKYPFIIIWFYFFSFSLPSIQRFLVSFKNYWIGPETLLYLWIQMESHSIVYALKKIDVAKLFSSSTFFMFILNFCVSILGVVRK